MTSSGRRSRSYGVDNTMKFYRLVLHPLFAEDFFTVIERQALTDPAAPE